jgi:uncharacterized membrane protein
VNAKHALSGLVWLAYPALILFGLQLMEPRYVALLLMCALVARHRRQVRRLMADMSWLDKSILMFLLGFSAMTAAMNSEILLRFYPVAVNAGMLSLFGLSLFRPPSMIERFARLKEPELPVEGIQYTRKLTQIWCLFFVANGGIATWTALGPSQKLWSFYNGFLSYVLMGLLFVGERGLRHFFLRTQK